MPHLHACRELYWAAAVFPLKKLSFTCTAWHSDNTPHGHMQNTVLSIANSMWLGGISWSRAVIMFGCGIVVLPGCWVVGYMLDIIPLTWETFCQFVAGPLDVGASSNSRVPSISKSRHSYRLLVYLDTLIRSITVTQALAWPYGTWQPRMWNA